MGLIAICLLPSLAQSGPVKEYFQVAKEPGFYREITCVGACRITPDGLKYWTIGGKEDRAMGSRIAKWLKREHVALSYSMGKEPYFAIVRCMPNWKTNRVLELRNTIAPNWAAQVLDAKSGLVILQAEINPHDGLLRALIMRTEAIAGPGDLDLTPGAALDFGGQKVTFVRAMRNENATSYMSADNQSRKNYSLWFQRSGKQSARGHLNLLLVDKDGRVPGSVDYFGRPSQDEPDLVHPSRLSHGLALVTVTPHIFWSGRSRIEQDDRSLIYDITVDPAYLRSVRIGISDWSPAYITGIPFQTKQSRR